MLVKYLSIKYLDGNSVSFVKDRKFKSFDGILIEIKKLSEPENKLISSEIICKLLLVKENTKVHYVCGMIIFCRDKKVFTL